jgi:hypothetical protein
MKINPGDLVQTKCNVTIWRDRNGTAEASCRLGELHAGTPAFFIQHIDIREANGDALVIAGGMFGYVCKSYLERMP